MKSYNFLIIFIILFGSSCKQASDIRIIKTLDTGWEFQKKLAAWGPELQFMTGEEFGAMIERQINMFSKPIERLKEN